MFDLQQIAVQNGMEKEFNLSMLLNKSKSAYFKKVRMSGKTIKQSAIKKAPIYLEQGVRYREDWAVKKNGVVLDNGFPDGKFISYVGFRDIPIGDWDWPDTIHPDACITITCLGDVISILEDDVKKHPAAVWLVYITPGGVRAFNVGETKTPEEYHSRMRDLKIDPLYIEICNQVADVHDAWKPLYKEKLFNVRVSSKVRDNDFVAFPLCKIGTQQGLPESIRKVRTYHDGFVISSNVKDEINPKNLSSVVKEKILKQVETIKNDRLRKSILNRLT